MIAATTTYAALTAKAATTTIPIVFELATDPVTLGLVPSLNRPGGNVTGVTQLNSVLEAKGLGLLYELVPKATAIAMLLNPNNPPSAEEGATAQALATAVGQPLRLVKASTQDEIDGPTLAVQPVTALSSQRYSEAISDQASAALSLHDPESSVSCCRWTPM